MRYCDGQPRDAWRLLTDLAPDQVNVPWYGLRTGIECQFKDCKGGGWQWQRTRMPDPERASRLWLVLAVALLYIVSRGSQAERQQPAPDLDAWPPTHIARRTALPWPPSCVVSHLSNRASLPNPWPDPPCKYLPL